MKWGLGLSREFSVGIPFAFYKTKIEAWRPTKPNSEQSEDGKPRVFGNKNKRMAGLPKSREIIRTGPS
jgi:hypothetical protein